MSNKSKFLKSAAIAVASVAIMSTNTSFAKDGKMEKCYGVAKTGKNDCSSARKGGHSCAGAAKTDGDKTEWVFVPSGLCDKLVGGSTKPTL